MTLGQIFRPDVAPSFQVVLGLLERRHLLVFDLKYLKATHGRAQFSTWGESGLQRWTKDRLLPGKPAKWVARCAHPLASDNPSTGSPVGIKG